MDAKKNVCLPISERSTLANFPAFCLAIFFLAVLFFLITALLGFLLIPSTKALNEKGAAVAY